MINLRIVALVAVLGVSSPTFAADLVVEADVAEAAISEGFDWTGFYLGVKGGYGAGNANFDTDTPTETDIPLAGWILGAVAGGGVQTDMFYLGVEGELSWTNIAGDADCPNPAFDCIVDGNIIADIEGQIGIAADQALFYVHGGLAAMNLDASTIELAGPNDNSVNGTAVGYVVGAGVKVAVTENIQLVGEYSFYNVSLNVPNPALGAPVSLTINPVFHVISVGVNAGF